MISPVAAQILFAVAHADCPIRRDIATDLVASRHRASGVTYSAPLARYRLTERCATAPRPLARANAERCAQSYRLSTETRGRVF